MFYLNFKDMLMRGEINMIKDDIFCVLSSSRYNAGDIELADISIGSRQAVLQGKSIIGGIFDARDTMFGDVPKDFVINSVILYNKDGILVACIENINGLPLTNIKENGILNVVWNNHKNKIIGI